MNIDTTLNYLIPSFIIDEPFKPYQHDVENATISMNDIRLLDHFIITPSYVPHNSIRGYYGSKFSEKRINEGREENRKNAACKVDVMDIDKRREARREKRRRYVLRKKDMSNPTPHINNTNPHINPNPKDDVWEHVITRTDESDTIYSSFNIYLSYVGCPFIKYSKREKYGDNDVEIDIGNNTENRLKIRKQNDSFVYTNVARSGWYYGTVASANKDLFVTGENDWRIIWTLDNDILVICKHIDITISGDKIHIKNKI